MCVFCEHCGPDVVSGDGPLALEASNGDHPLLAWSDAGTGGGGSICSGIAVRAPQAGRVRLEGVARSRVLLNKLVPNKPHIETGGEEQTPRR